VAKELGSKARQAWTAAAFLVILCAGLWTLSVLCDQSARADVRQKASWTFMHTGGDFDFVILGSSRAYTTTDVHTLEDTLGERGLNIAEDGAGYLESELVLKHFLARNSVCTVVMEVDWFGSDTTGKNPNLWKYVPFLGDSMVDSYIARNDLRKFYLWSWVPFAKYAEFNERIGWRSVLHILRSAPSPFDDRGTYLLDGQFTVPVGSRHKVARAVVDSSLDDALKRIFAIAKAHGINVVLYMAPEFGGMLPLFVSRPAMIDHYRELSRERESTLLLFDSLPLVADSTNFRDAIHVSRHGAMPFSAALAHELKAQHLVRNCH
jgi:hypothetical protein